MSLRSRIQNSVLLLQRLLRTALGPGPRLPVSRSARCQRRSGGPTHEECGGTIDSVFPQAEGQKKGAHRKGLIEETNRAGMTGDIAKSDGGSESVVGVRAEPRIQSQAL